jgi:predicted nucleic acid-binding protein
MIAVSNTTPLRYLIAIGQDDLLGKLFEKVFVPTGVHEEFAEAGAATTELRTSSIPFGVRR